MSDRGSIRLPQSDFQQVRNELLRLQLELNKRVTLGQLIMTAFNIALRHRSELIKELNKDE